MAYLSLMAAPSLDDFTILQALGDGSSGTVYLVRENDTRGLYALKAIQKHKRCRTQVEIETVMAERNALLDLRGDDFILQLRACFHDSRNYYLVTEYHPAGDLHSLLLLKGSPWSVVRFYMAELLLALEHTHAKRIVHRDVKPENVFIDNDGHIVLGDFGLARKLRAKEDTITTDDMFGTPAYTPPEVFTGKPYGREVDLWAFGVMLYELITGKEAFKANLPQDDPTWLAHLARNILHDELETSPYLTPDSTDLIEKLLRKGPKTRLRNFDEIKKHPFFSGIDWDLLSNRSLTPPWIPIIGQGNDPGPDYPALTAGKPYSAEDDPIRGLSFRFSPMALTPTCQRHQRFFHSLGGALPALVDWVEGSKPTLEVSSSSSCTDKGSYDLADTGKYPSFSLHRTPVRKKKLRPLTRWARSIFSRCSDASGS
ncbi:kinase-like domain-containing protein [Lactifluus subvellereus]|nr:kinase-like domain-containing protein [Lactifluus subvellereus]